MVERTDCESMTVMKRSVLRIVQIFVASSRESGTEVLNGEPHVTTQKVSHTDVILVFNISESTLCPIVLYVASKLLEAHDDRFQCVPTIWGG